MPKSVSFTSPSNAMRMFLRLTSRWTMPSDLPSASSLCMRVGQSARYTTGDEHRQFSTGRTRSFARNLVGELFEINAANQFHRDEITAFGFAEMIQLPELLLCPGELLRQPLRLALGFFTLLDTLGAGFGAFLFPLFLAGVAFAADRLQVGLEVIGAVIVVDLVARLDVLDGADVDSFACVGARRFRRSACRRG